MAINTDIGSASAQAYASVADADAYFSARGMTNWATLSTTEKENAIIRGADYLQQTYRQRFAGYRVSITQALDFPRYMVPMADMGTDAYYPATSIPTELVYANCEAAIRAAAGELLEDVEPTVASEKVGPLETSYFQGASKIKKYPVIDRLLAPLLTAGGGIKMVRA